MGLDMLTHPLDGDPLSHPCAQVAKTWFNLDRCYPPAMGELVLVRYRKCRDAGARLVMRDNEGYRCVILGCIISGVTHYAYIHGPDQLRILEP